jgi:hypothetical protein
LKLLILSDLHGNWPALEAVLAAEESWDAVACCGDLVDYGPNPAECVRWVAKNAEFRVRGNHDNALAFGIDCRCMGSFREASLATRAWHRNMLDDCVRIATWRTSSLRLPTAQETWDERSSRSKRARGLVGKNGPASSHGI